MALRSLQATCVTDESSDDDEPTAVRKQRSQSNVAAKRISHSTTHTVAQRPGRTTAGSSADPSKSSSHRRASPVKVRAPPAAPDAPAPAPAPAPVSAPVHRRPSTRSAQACDRPRHHKSKTPVLVQQPPMDGRTVPTRSQSRLSDSRPSASVSQSPRVPLSPNGHPSTTTFDNPTFHGSRSHSRPASFHGMPAPPASAHGSMGAAVRGRPPPAMYNHPYAAMLIAPSPVGYYPQPPLSSPHQGRPLMPRMMSDGHAAPSRPNPRYGSLPSVAPYQPPPVEHCRDVGDTRYDRPVRDRSMMAQPLHSPSRSQPAQSIRSAMHSSVAYRDDVNRYADGPPMGTRPSLRLNPADRGYDICYSSPEADHVFIQPARPRDSEREQTRRNTMYNRTLVPHLDIDDEGTRASMDYKVRNAEDYQYSTGAGVDDLPFSATGRRQPSNDPRAGTVSHSQHRFYTSSRTSDASRSINTRRTTTDGNVSIKLDRDNVTVVGDMDGKTVQLTKGDDGSQQIVIANYRGRHRNYRSEGSCLTTNTSSTRSHSDRDSARPRYTAQMGYNDDREHHYRTRRQREDPYVDDDYHGPYRRL